MAMLELVKAEWLRLLSFSVLFLSALQNLERQVHFPVKSMNLKDHSMNIKLTQKW